MDQATFSPQKLAKPFQSEDRPRHYVLFRMDRQHYALPLDHVIRAVRMVTFTPIPDAPQSVLGIINMAGQMLPVIDLRRLFGQTGKDPELQDFLLIIQTQGQIVAVIVDEVLNVLEFTSKQVEFPPAALLQSRFLVAAVQQENFLVWILDVSRLLSNNDERIGFTPLENPAIYGEDDINKDSTPIKTGGGKAPPFLTGLTR